MDALHTLARLDRGGWFAERGACAPAVADFVRCTRVESRRLVAVAASVFYLAARRSRWNPTARTGRWRWVLGDRPGACRGDGAGVGFGCRRASTPRRGRARGPVGGLGADLRPDQLVVWPGTGSSTSTRTARPPTSLMSWSTSCTWRNPGPVVVGRSKPVGCFTFDVLARAIRASLKPAADENKTLGQRQPDALGESVSTPRYGYLPAGGGTPAHHRHHQTSNHGRTSPGVAGFVADSAGRCAGCVRGEVIPWCWGGTACPRRGRDNNVASPWPSAKPWPPGTGDVLILGVIGRPGCSVHTSQCGASRRVKHYQPRDVM